ncbi:MAG: FHA domain-containing protein [Phycisphaerales bacterium]|nr:MAG: FHA domain-containing protein [Phycisphaerales bacterium]
MYIVQKQNGQVIDRRHFASGVVHIGRGANCQVLLKSGEVSRQHAVIFVGNDAAWWLKDLSSANGTQLNGRRISLAKLQNGDCIRIGDFSLEIDLKDTGDLARQPSLDDTVVDESCGPRVIARPLDMDDAPPIRMPARRTADFIQAGSAFGKASGPGPMLQAILEILERQFTAARVWCGLRYSASGPWTIQDGKTDEGESFQLRHTMVKEELKQALEKRTCLLILGVKDQTAEGSTRSALIAPLAGMAGNYGALYLDNHPRRVPYQLSDLDYLAFLALHLGAVLEDY